MRTTLPTMLIVAASTAQADPKIVTDIAPVASIASQIMGDIGTLDTLLPPGADPHDFALRPSDAQALTEADALFWVGEGLTPWLEGPVANLVADTASVELMETSGWLKLDVRTLIEDHHGHDDHDDHDDHAGHDHEGTDPHGWYSPAVAVAWANTITQKLSEIDANNAAQYADNQRVFENSISELTNEMRATLSDMPPILWAHDGYQYLEKELGLTAFDLLSSYDGEQPGPATLRDIRDRMAGTPEVCIVLDQTISDAMGRTLSEGLENKVVRINTLTTDTYQDMMRQLSADLSQCKIDS